MIVLGFEENAPGANITTGGDALWWAFVSITTVGYGDKYPITTGGRTAAVFVLAAGVGLFGVLSGYLANFFLAPAKTDDDDAQETTPGADGATTTAAGSGQRVDVLAALDDLEARISALRASLADPVEPA